MCAMPARAGLDNRRSGFEEKVAVFGLYQESV